MSERPAERFEIDRASITEPAGRVARFLAAHAAGDARVAILAGNTPEFIIAREAVTALDRVAVPVNPKLAPPEVAFVLADARPAVVLCTDELAPVAAAALGDLPDNGAAPAVVSIAQAARTPGAPRPLRHAIGATLIYTSGTTGYPKGCFRSEAQEAARAAELTRTYGLSADDVHLIACPLAHSAPGIFLRAGMAAGARTVVMSRFRPEAFLDAVAETRATFFFLVPTQYERILALPNAARRARDTSSIRCAIVAGAPIAPTTKQRLVAWLGDGVLWEFYGSSETGTVAVLPPRDQLTHLGSVGLPPAGVDVRIVDEDGDPIAPGTVGEIYVRSPTVMQGYLAADRTIVRPAGAVPGFVSVGDLGRIDDDGYLYLVDRKHDTIISGGVNVYPAEVERVVAAHPDVAGVVCFGKPDPDWGQIVALVVAPRDPSVDAATFAQTLRAWLRPRVAPFKIPKAIAVVPLSELPIGSSGKPLRRLARGRSLVFHFFHK